MSTPKIESGMSQRGLRGGFTLVEMLVVLAIIIVLVLIALPAFSAMLRSNARVQAEESLKAAVTLARDLALRGGPGQDSAVIFLQDPGEPLRAVAGVKVGTLSDERVLNTNTSTTVLRSVFVPVPEVQAVVFPSGFGVRGWITPGVIGPEYYNVSGSGANAIGRYDAGEASWVLPESGYYRRLYDSASALRAGDDGRDRCSFMVRFEGGTGMLLSASSDAALFVLPRPSASGREEEPWANNRLDQTDNLARAVQRVLNAATLRSGVQPQSPAQVNDDRRRLIGHRSSDTVLAFPVTQLAVSEESLLAAALGVRLDASSGTLLRHFPALASNPRTPSLTLGPFFVPAPAGGFGVYGNSDTSLSRAANAWILGDTNLDGRFDEADPDVRDTTDRPAAKVMTVNRYTGELEHVPIRVPEGSN